MNTIRLLPLLSASLLAVSAQTMPVINSTPAPADARFTMIQGNNLGIYSAVYKLDRYTGRIWMESAEKGSYTWVSAPVIDLPPITEPKGPRFQMVWILIPSKEQILLDCQTGRTWHERVSHGGIHGEWKPDQPMQEATSAAAPTEAPPQTIPQKSTETAPQITISK